MTQYDFKRSQKVGGADPPSAGAFWLGLMLLIVVHIPYFACSFEYLRKQYGFENVFTFAFTLVSIIYLSCVMTIKYEVMHKPADQWNIDGIVEQKIYGLNVHQWRAMYLFLMAINFCFLLLACMGNMKRIEDRFYHAIIVFGCLFLFIDHTQLKTEEQMSVLFLIPEI